MTDSETTRLRKGITISLSPAGLRALELLEAKLDAPPHQVIEFVLVDAMCADLNGERSPGDRIPEINPVTLDETPMEQWQIDSFNPLLAK